jgi:(S)-2-hydroxyglutarate dehydrogenase
MKQSETYDFAIIGGGIIGVAIGIALLEKNPTKKVIILEKESRPGVHASGRNSGVIHAGFYYSPESLKAKFCKDGNSEITKYCKDNDLPFKNLGKVVVTKDETEVTRLHKLFETGLINKIEIELHPAEKLRDFEPAANSFGDFIWSPTTSIADPNKLIVSLVEKYKRLGGEINFKSKSELKLNNSEVSLFVNGSQFKTNKIVNAAGGMAATIARNVGVGKQYLCLPFLGSYRKSDSTTNSIKRLIYPVPNPVNPFLGVHTTNTLNGDLKIGPTAFPVIGKEQYRLVDGFTFKEFNEFIVASWAMFNSKKTDFPELAKTELLKQFESKILNSSKYLSDVISLQKDWKKHPGGIRSQIVNVETKELEMDYIVTSDKNVVHVLNAVSPGWTSALPFARWIVESNSL